MSVKFKGNANVRLYTNIGNAVNNGNVTTNYNGIVTTNYTKPLSNKEHKNEFRTTKTRENNFYETLEPTLKPKKPGINSWIRGNINNTQQPLKQDVLRDNKSNSPPNNKFNSTQPIPQTVTNPEQSNITIHTAPAKLEPVMNHTNSASANSKIEINSKNSQPNKIGNQPLKKQNEPNKDLKKKIDALKTLNKSIIDSKSLKYIKLQQGIALLLFRCKSNLPFDKTDMEILDMLKTYIPKKLIMNMFTRNKRDEKVIDAIKNVLDSFEHDISPYISAYRLGRKKRGGLMKTKNKQRRKKYTTRKYFN
jgi:hypothetical protein